MPRYRHAVLGGTFDQFHIGHEALLATALRVARRVSIGITSERYLAAHPKPRGRYVQSYRTRERALRRWLSRRAGSRSWRLVPIEDRFGGSVEGGVDVLVVSADTLAGGKAVNKERRRRGRRSVPLVVVPLVLAEDLDRVSSRRIRAGVIDRFGRRRKPLTVGVGLSDPADRAAVIRAVRRSFARPTIHVTALAPRGGGSTPRRARSLAARAGQHTELGVGVARRPSGGWVLVERSRWIALDPRTVPGRTPEALAQGLARLLRPGRAKPL